ncbi:MAG: hypothetical protein AAFV54_09695, partial [Pseudomonadota bacterium]
MTVKQVLLASAALVVASGAGTLGLTGTDRNETPPFIAPLALNQAVCSSVDGRASRKATFMRLGYAMAQSADHVTELDDLAPDTIATVAYRISTSSEEAQEWFDRGLAYTFGFNHAAAIEAFKRAQAADPDCAMCYWGEAFAWGPNINAPMVDEAVQPAFDAS